MTCHTYPPLFDDARTFGELFWSYMLSWIDEVYPETYYITTHEPYHYAEWLFRRAQAIAKQFPAVDLWDCLEPALRHTMQWYVRKKAPFDKLFERNLREQLWKATARDAEKAARRARRERRYADESRRRQAEQDDVAAAYSRWSIYLLDVVAERLNRQARTYIEMRRQGASVKDIAAALGVTEKTLWNKYGGAKLARRVQQEVRLLVLELPDQHRRLLARHLLDEVGLNRAQAQRLLGVPVASDSSVPLMEEEAVLKLLGWCRKKTGRF